MNGNVQKCTHWINLLSRVLRKSIKMVLVVICEWMQMDWNCHIICKISISPPPSFHSRSISSTYTHSYDYIYAELFISEEKYFHRILIHNYSMSYLISKMKLKQPTTATVIINFIIKYANKLTIMRLISCWMLSFFSSSSASFQWLKNYEKNVAKSLNLSLSTIPNISLHPHSSSSSFDIGERKSVKV